MSKSYLWYVARWREGQLVNISKGYETESAAKSLRRGVVADGDTWTISYTISEEDWEYE